MNVLFLFINTTGTIDRGGIYHDLMREYKRRGHTIYTLLYNGDCAGKRPCLVENDDVFYLSLPVDSGRGGRNIIRKGLSTVSVEFRLLDAVKKCLSDVRFDLIVYATPPITFYSAVKYLKERDNAKTYLLLKDIFPQNAVDMGMMAPSGLKAPIYRYFRKKERMLYGVSDRIGCMSPANMEYLLAHNQEIPQEKVELSPNCMEPQRFALLENERDAIRARYGIPADKKVYVYGGNLGRPQGIPFIMKCLKSVQDHANAYFLIVGDGSEYGKLAAFLAEEKPKNVKLLQRLPRDDYDRMITACDVGLIFLDHRFTIPNFPSRLLAYMQAKLPVIACTDVSSDIGDVIVDGGFGWWCESNSPAAFRSVMEESLRADLKAMGEKGNRYLLEHYTVKRQYEMMMESIARG